MPPKRKSTGSTSSPKRARASSSGAASNEASSAPQDATATPQLSAASKRAIDQLLDRWSEVSCSKNLEKGIQDSLADSKKPFEYVCQCESPFESLEDDDEEEGEGEEGGNQETQDAAPPAASDGVLQALPPHDNVACSHGEDGICGKAAAEHPEHPWAIMRAAVHKFNSTWMHLDVRDPDVVGMYTSNDHHGYGWMQVFQNLILDYQVGRLRENWREQWLVCTVVGRLAMQAYKSPMFMIEDGDGIDDLFLLIWSLFLDMLATLEGAGQLDPSTTEVKDLGQVMACFIISAQQLRNVHMIEKPARNSKPESFDAYRIDGYIVAYAQRHNITLQMPEPYRTKAVEETAGASPDMLPAPAAKQYWGFEQRLEEYEDQYKGTWAKASKQQGIIGGDSLDITSWKPADRKKSADGQKDPLPRQVIKALKDVSVSC
ncbi:hypothetical protein MCOR16_002875 [Pyricularia oryzae]|nr:hypothetical protein MCOR16_002875 [Pyricularia oryzae]